MRNLEEWWAFVDEQSRKAQELRDHKSASAESDVQRNPPEKRAEERKSDTASEAKVAKPRVSAEGRALLSWQTTLPVDAENAPFSAKTEEASKAAQALIDESVKAIHERADEASDATRSLESERHQPLKPYQSKDPRYRSSVAPPRLRNEKRSLLVETPLNSVQAVSDSDDSDSDDSVNRDSTNPLKEESEIEANPPESREVAGAESETETSLAVKRARRITAKTAMRTEPKETAEEAQSLWERVPRHVRSLIRSQSDEIAQNSYKMDFRETRGELIRRLLDPELSLEEAARVLGVCPTTVRRYTNRGLLQHHRTGGNQRRFRLSDVLEFMEKFSATLKDDNEKESAVENSMGERRIAPPSERDASKGNALQERPA